MNKKAEPVEADLVPPPGPHKAIKPWVGVWKYQESMEREEVSCARFSQRRVTTRHPLLLSRAVTNSLRGTTRDRREDALKMN